MGEIRENIGMKVGSKIVELLKDKCKYYKTIRLSKTFILGTRCYIRIDALEAKDYPHNIEENSIYMDFIIDFNENKFEVYRVGHIYLSPSDLKTDRYKYYAMKSMTNVYVDKGGKKFRKTKYKDEETTANKIADYFNNVMESVIQYTGGYPYKEGIE